MTNKGKKILELYEKIGILVGMAKVGGAYQEEEADKIAADILKILADLKVLPF